MVKDQTLRTWYRGFNRRYFHEQLPDIPIRFGDCGKEVAAFTGFVDGLATEIVIDKYLRPLPQYIKVCILHEQCHVAVGNQEKAYHGPLWKKERRRLMDAGAFTSLL